ncbi:MAG: 50S ribosomal protein L11 methyltransferase [Desulfamplus sp.]|nr:50S ribosomal protein L11 methyltransferase [Desulfamplus sp.]
MKWIHVKALFESDDIAFGEEMVSDIFFSLGLTGVVCQVPLEEPTEGFGSDALPIPDEIYISGYIPNTDSSIETLKQIKKRAEEIKASGIKVTIQTYIVDQEDWAESWKSFFHVSRITDRIVIKPAWREFKQAANDIVIELDPGMAFGTGTHPTTSMCISFIERYLQSGDNFLDVGTGSGILMIAAAKLGASYLVGIDIDEVAIQVASENIIKNAISSERFEVKIATLEQYISKSDMFQFDLISANIIAEVLIDIMSEMKTSLKKDGIVILSGIIKDREQAVKECLNHNGFAILDVKNEGEWIAIAAKK